MKGPLLIGGWALTLAAAFLVGRGLGGDASPVEPPSQDADRVSQLERRVEELKQKLADAQARRPRGDGVRERDRADATEAKLDPSSASSAAPSPESPLAAPEAF